MEQNKLDEILKKHKLWLEDNGKGERADLQDADLRDANLQDADLRGANLQDANLQYANLRGANLRGANLQDADLRGANLRYADLRGANLQDADLQGANLRYADLQYADLRDTDIDYSCWPLWCGSKDVKVDARIAMQLAAHFCVLDCDDKDYLKAKKAILAFAKKSHRAADLGIGGEDE